MNKSEIKAFEYLKNKGIEVMDNTGKGTPDFIGKYKGYEVKKLYGNQLIFYPNQIKKVEKNCDIIVIDEGKVISVKNYQDTLKIFKIKVAPLPEGQLIKVDEKLKKFLDSKKLIPRESYKSVLKRLLKLR